MSVWSTLQDLPWADIGKFTPGYLSFAWLCGTGIRKGFVRRNRVRIGPADEVRQALTGIRTVLKDLMEKRRPRSWLLEKGRRDLADRLEDIANRVVDAQLRDALRELAGTWTDLIAITPPGRVGVSFVDLQGGSTAVAADRRRRQEEGTRYEEQADRAAQALESVAVALRRLDRLERKTIGR